MNFPQTIKKLLKLHAKLRTDFKKKKEQ